jgi:hypothetical protein
LIEELDLLMARNTGLSPEDPATPGA